MTLRPPALADISRFRRTNFTRQLNNTFYRNTGDRGRPLWRFRHAIAALANDPEAAQQLRALQARRLHLEAQTRMVSGG